MLLEPRLGQGVGERLTAAEAAVGELRAEAVVREQEVVRLRNARDYALTIVEYMMDLAIPDITGEGR